MTTASAQFETATVSGRIVDPSGLSVAGAQVKLVDIDRDTGVTTSTNGSGLYTLTGVHPGRYRMEVLATGFKLINVTGLTINAQDHLEQNFSLALGSVSESVTVEATAVNVSGEVSTVVDRNFAENLPMNGRSFQTLIQLTPGVVLTQSTTNDSGQFSVNGQRASSNYWMVDGVGANVGAAPFATPGNSLGGASFGFSAQGGTNSLVSVDAMQEFRIQTSTFAPEFGRTPGGQISIVTRSGTNQFHGTVFDYLRNDLFDANDWFAGLHHLPKPQERQNDFGGTLSGPLFRNRTFFFFSYEGLRLRLPQVGLTTVPDLGARQAALPALQPFLNAFPLPTGADDVVNGIAESDASFSNQSTLDAYSIRVDHRLNDKLSIFGRYNYSPSRIVSRGSGAALNQLFPQDIGIQTATAGATWNTSPTMVNDFRLNYSRSSADSSLRLDNFGGAVPLTSLPFPAGVDASSAQFAFFIFDLTNGSSYTIGPNARNLQRQWNVVDTLALQRGGHALKLGVDFRRLSPLFRTQAYAQTAAFLDVPSAGQGSPLFFSDVNASLDSGFSFRNLGVFAQDTWRVVPRLTLTYGLRWDVDFSPSATQGPDFAAVTGFNLNDLSNLALAPAGTPAFRTPYGNVAPRVGVAWQLSDKQGWERMLRGGFGVFFDLATQEFGNNNVGRKTYPFGADRFTFGGSFPLDPVTAAPPLISAASVASTGVFAFDPNLKLPYTLEWNAAFEQSFGPKQNLSLSYVGAAGRRLIATAAVIAPPNANVGGPVLITNAGSSNYNGLDVQFQRRLSSGLQALASYTWSHSIDTGSAGSFGNLANALVPSINPNINRGPSDFDIRHAFSLALTYNIPAPKFNPVAGAFLRGWSIQSIIQARSAPPVNVVDGNFFFFQNSLASIRPDVVPGQPFYLSGPQFPGGKALNPAAFVDPPVDMNFNPLRQGDLGRNALRAFGLSQWDFGVHRDFPIRENVHLQFRAEFFNLLNHPNFAPPPADISLGGFGISNALLGQYLGGGNVGGGGFSALYQVGGPRSIQFSLKLEF